jgi:hypothetical protein
VEAHAPRPNHLAAVRQYIRTPPARLHTTDTQGEWDRHRHRHTQTDRQTDRHAWMLVSPTCTHAGASAVVRVRRAGRTRRSTACGCRRGGRSGWFPAATAAPACAKAAWPASGPPPAPISLSQRAPVRDGAGVRARTVWTRCALSTHRPPTLTSVWVDVPRQLSPRARSDQGAA